MNAVSPDPVGGKELCDDAEFDEGEAQALSGELGREFGDLEPEGAEYEDISPDKMPEQKRGREHATRSFSAGLCMPRFVRCGAVQHSKKLRRKVLPLGGIERPIWE